MEHTRHQQPRTPLPRQTNNQWLLHQKQHWIQRMGTRSHTLRHHHKPIPPSKNTRRNQRNPLARKHSHLRTCHTRQKHHNNLTTTTHGNRSIPLQLRTNHRLHTNTFQTQSCLTRTTENATRHTRIQLYYTPQLSVCSNHRRRNHMQTCTQ